MSIQCAECLRCDACVQEVPAKPLGSRGRHHDLKDMQMKSRALPVEIYGNSHSSWRRCFESSFFTVTSKVTDVMTELRQLKESCEKHGENLVQGWGYVLTLTTHLWPFLSPADSLPRLKFIVQAKPLEGVTEDLSRTHNPCRGGKHDTLGDWVGVNTCKT